LFSSSLFVGVSALTLTNRALAAVAFKWTFTKLEILLMGGLIMGGFFVLNGVLKDIEFRTVTAVGDGLLTTVAIWIIISWRLDWKGYFSRKVPTFVYEAAVAAGEKVVSKIDAQRILELAERSEKAAEDNVQELNTRVKDLDSRLRSYEASGRNASARSRHAEQLQRDLCFARSDLAPALQCLENAKTSVTNAKAQS
jgi:hypothetical protein